MERSLIFVPFSISAKPGIAFVENIMILHDDTRHSRESNPV